MRILLTLLTLSAVALAHGQSQHHFFAAQQAYDHADLKYVIQAVVDLDPNADVYHSDDMTVLQVRSAATEAELRNAINEAGILLQAGTPELNTATPGPTATADGKPLFVLTGDPAADQARYVAAVAAWNALHADDTIEVLPIIIE